MEKDIIFKLKKDEKLHDYLKKHSYWYTYLNRNSSYYDDLVKEYKKFNRSKNIEKINSTIDNAELLSNIIKMID